MTLETEEGESSRERPQDERHQRPLPAALAGRAQVWSLRRWCRRERPLRHDRPRRSLVTSPSVR
jgi:hypothetical protein